MRKIYNKITNPPSHSQKQVSHLKTQPTAVHPRVTRKGSPVWKPAACVRVWGELSGRKTWTPACPQAGES